MAITYYSNLPTQKLFSVFSAFLVIFLVLKSRKVNSSEITKFIFSSFKDHDDEITLQGGSKISNGILELTSSAYPLPNVATGHALYAKEVHIWDSTTRNVASFVTSFSVSVKDFTQADGIVFFLAPPDIEIPENSGGENLGIIDGKNALNRFVGVEFDNCYRTILDPDFPHIGIDANSIISLNTMRWNWKSGSLFQVSIIYDSLSKTLSVSMTDYNGDISIMQQIIDLRSVLPEKIRVGFSASTTFISDDVPKHDIYSWSFTSNLETSSSSSNITENTLASFA